MTEQQHNKYMDYVFGKIETLPYDDGTSTEIVQEQNTDKFLTSIEKCVNNEKAVRLYTIIPKLTVAKLISGPMKNENLVLDLFGFLGIKDIDMCMQEIIRNLLLFWQDPVAGQNFASSEARQYWS